MKFLRTGRKLLNRFKNWNIQKNQFNVCCEIIKSKDTLLVWFKKKKTYTFCMLLETLYVHGAKIFPIPVEISRYKTQYAGDGHLIWKIPYFDESAVGHVFLTNMLKLYIKLHSNSNGTQYYLWWVNFHSSIVFNTHWKRFNNVFNKIVYSILASIVDC